MEPSGAVQLDFVRNAPFDAWSSPLLAPAAAGGAAAAAAAVAAGGVGLLGGKVEGDGEAILHYII